MLGTILPMVKRVIMRCDADGVTYQDGDGYPPAFETKAILVAWLGFYISFPFGNVEPIDARAKWGV